MANFEVKAWHRKYPAAIRKMEPITKEELMAQIKADHNIISPDDIEHATSVWPREGQPLVEKVIANREDKETPTHRKVMLEYQYRTQILKLFPKAYEAWLAKWSNEKLRETHSSVLFKDWMAKQTITPTDVERVMGDMLEPSTSRPSHRAPAARFL